MISIYMVFHERFFMKSKDLPSFCSNSGDACPVFTDEALLYQIRNGSEAAFDELFRRYADRIRSLSKDYFSGSLTEDDWFQEGVIGFLHAVHAFRADGTASFSTYASVCIRNSLNSAWRKANNSGNLPLNQSVALEESVLSCMDSPEEEYIQKEHFRLFSEKYRQQLSAAEQNVIACYLAGYSYSEMAKRLGMNEKSVDNAVFRAKAKLKKYFKSQ